MNMKLDEIVSKYDRIEVIGLDLIKEVAKINLKKLPITWYMYLHCACFGLASKAHTSILITGTLDNLVMFELLFPTKEEIDDYFFGNVDLNDWSMGGYKIGKKLSTL